MVVDDDESVLDLLGDVLGPGGLGCKVLEAHDATEALLLLSLHRVHLVVTDYMMPGMDGLELARSIRAKLPIPVVLISGAMDQTIADLAIAQGVSNVIRKPIDIPSFTDTVAKLLKEHETPRPGTLVHSR